MSQRKVKHFATPVLGAVLVLAVAAAGCGKKESAEPPPPPTETPAPAPTPDPIAATAVLAGPDGSEFNGTVTFTQVGNEVQISAKVNGVSPGDHGFHIHENGVCEGDFSSAGDHFNPGGHPHGGPGEPEVHAGDLGNIPVGEAGNGILNWTSTTLTVDPGPNSVVGRAVILHAKADDLESQPTGAAGGRIACGVIERPDEVVDADDSEY